jgi:hypothetical protein
MSEQNTEQVRRLAHPIDALQQSRDAMREPPPVSSPNSGAGIVGTVPTNAADAERVILDGEAKADGEWPPAFLRR